MWYNPDLDGPPSDEHVEQVDEMQDTQRRYQDYLAEQEHVQEAPTAGVLNHKDLALYIAQDGKCYHCHQPLAEGEAERLTLAVPARTDVLVHRSEILIASIKAARQAGLLRGGVLGRASTLVRKVAA